MKKFVIIAIILIFVAGGVYLYFNKSDVKPKETLNEYISKINEEDYSQMYQMISSESKNRISEEDFVSRNKNIYSGIEMTNIKSTVNDLKFESSKKVKLSYTVTMNTSGGEISFENITTLLKENDEYKIEWSSNMIFPNLDDENKVKVSTDKALRGKILDRNGVVLAENGKASSVGVVKGKLGENKEKNIEKIAELLNTTSDSINNKLQAAWVKDDSFVPIKTVQSTETELKEKLLLIPGVKIITTNARVYSLGEAGSHLTGYIGQITKEELEKSSGYTGTSLIGKAGIEKAYEERLKGKNGLEIYIVDSDGNKKETIIKQEKVDGEDIKLTIDSRVQKNLYNELKNDEGSFVVMNHKTGEILALVSTPSYDVNKMTLGMSSLEWQELQNDVKNPMLSRFQQRYSPGSTFKPITAAIGLETKSITTDDTFNYSGLSWQKDKSWGDFTVTTLTGYSGAKNLKNALIHSDNIYFAQEALKIGKTNFIEGLKKLKFNENIDFELLLAKSQYSNTDTISSEGALANSGYGQGEILVNPVHMASIYSSFINEGNMLKPYLEYKETSTVEYLVQNAISKETSEIIKQDLIQVVENPEGTAKDMKINGITIAGKTGTAELKTTKQEKADTIGWFDCFTVENQEPLLIIGMVEKANQNGGSHYLIPMIRRMFIK